MTVAEDNPGSVGTCTKNALSGIFLLALAHRHLVNFFDLQLVPQVIYSLSRISSSGQKIHNRLRAFTFVINISYFVRNRLNELLSQLFFYELSCCDFGPVMSERANQT